MSLLDELTNAAKKDYEPTIDRSQLKPGKYVVEFTGRDLKEGDTKALILKWSVVDVLNGESKVGETGSDYLPLEKGWQVEKAANTVKEIIAAEAGVAPTEITSEAVQKFSFGGADQTQFRIVATIRTAKYGSKSKTPGEPVVRSDGSVAVNYSYSSLT